MAGKFIGVLWCFTCGTYGAHQPTNLHQERVEQPQAPAEPEKGRSDASKSKSALSNAPHSKLNGYQDRLDAMSSSDVKSWREFLSMYGPQGVGLQELLSLILAVYSPTPGFPDYRYWSPSGDRMLAKPSISGTHFLKLLRDASTVEDVIALERRLVTVGAVYVRRSMLMLNNDRRWFAEPNKHFDETDSLAFCQDLVAVYALMPEKDVHLLAESHREIFYHHAHIATLYIYLKMEDGSSIFRDLEESFRDMVLKVISYRYQRGDETLRRFIENPVYSRELVWRESTLLPHQSQYRKVMLGLAALQAVRGRQSIINDDLLRKTMVSVHDAVPGPIEGNEKTWGMMGFALAEIINLAEVACDQALTAKAVRRAREWCGIALVSKTPIEVAALCCLLSRLRAFDKLSNMPQESHLMCGYYLARTGSHQQASQLLLSGIHYCEQNMPTTPIWTYYIEFWTMAMSQGLCNEAESWLVRAWRDLRPAVYDPLNGSLNWKDRSEEDRHCASTLATLISDCCTAQGQFRKAERMLIFAVRALLTSRDDFVRHTRTTLYLRLLNVQMELGSFKQAGLSALRLCDELKERDTATLQPQTVSWVVQEVLACTNKLFQESMYLEVYHILYVLRRSLEGSDAPAASEDIDFKELQAYITQRWRDVLSKLHSAPTMGHQSLYKLRRLGCLIGSPEDVNALLEHLDPLLPADLSSIHLELDYYVAESSALGKMQSLPSKIRQFIHFQLWDDWKLVMESKLEDASLSSSTFMTANAIISNAAETPAKALDPPSIRQIARHIAQDHPFSLPPAAGKTEPLAAAAVQHQKIGPPASDLELSTSETAPNQGRKLSPATRPQRQARLRRMFRMLSNLPAPPSIIKSQATGVAESGEKIGNATDLQAAAQEKRSEIPVLEMTGAVPGPELPTPHSPRQDAESQEFMAIQELSG